MDFRRVSIELRSRVMNGETDAQIWEDYSKNDAVRKLYGEDPSKKEYRERLLKTVAEFRDEFMRDDISPLESAYNLLLVKQQLFVADTVDALKLQAPDCPKKLREVAMAFASLANTPQPDESSMKSAVDLLQDEKLSARFSELFPQ